MDNKFTKDEVILIIQTFVSSMILGTIQDIFNDKFVKDMITESLDKVIELKERKIK